MVAGTPNFDTARAQLAPCRSGAGTGARIFSAGASARPGATTSTSSSATTAATPATTSCAAISTDLVVRPGTCYAQSGVLHDLPGAVISFLRGPDTSNSIEIDHVVSLADAWYKRRAGLGSTAPTRLRQRPAQPACREPEGQLRQGFPRRRVRLPPNAAFRCDFVARQVAVKTAYGLWLSAKEKQAMADVLARC